MKKTTPKIIISKEQFVVAVWEDRLVLTLRLDKVLPYLGRHQSCSDINYILPLYSNFALCQ